MAIPVLEAILSFHVATLQKVTPTFKIFSAQLAFGYTFEKRKKQDAT